MCYMFYRHSGAEMLEDLSIVIPAYNEDNIKLHRIVEDLQMLGAQVTVVDDGSKDPFPTAICHPENRGYGEAIMTGIRFSKNDIILTMDADGQHRIEDVINLYKVWKMLEVDMLVGARRLDYEEPLRMWGRKGLNFIASLFTGIYMQDMNSGLRMFKKNIALGYFPILCKTFSFTTSLIMSFMTDKYRVEWFPIKVLKRNSGKSHVNVISVSCGMESNEI